MMTLRSKGLKLIIAVSVIMLAILVFNVNNAYATSIEEIKDIIPNTINVDISEAEYKKAQDLIESQVKQIIKQSNIEDKENLKVKVSYNGGYGTVETFYKARVILGDTYKQSKEVNIIFNNTDKSINEDEQYIKSLKLENPKYIEMNLDYLEKNKDIWDWFNNYITEYYTNIINDKTVKVSTFVGAGTVEGLDLGTTEGGIYLYLFRNNKLYNINHIGNLSLIPVITVPSTVLDDELEKYVISKIKQHYPDYGDLITNVEKGVTDDSMVNVDIYKTMNDIYTVKVRENTGPGCLIIVRKEKTKIEPVIKTDTTTNIKLDTTSDVVPSGTVLKAEKVTAGNNYNVVVKALGSDVAKFEMFDISLSNNNTKIQPNGKVKVSIPVPAGFNTSKIAVYYVAEDGTKTKIDATVKDGYIVFETDHFSNYVVAEENDTSTKTKDTTNTNTSKTEAEVKTSTNTTVIANTSENASQSTQTSTKTQNTTNTRKLDNTPKTGLENNITPVVTAIISSLSAVCLAVIKRF